MLQLQRVNHGFGCLKMISKIRRSFNITRVVAIVGVGLGSFSNDVMTMAAQVKEGKVFLALGVKASQKTSELSDDAQKLHLSFPYSSVTK